MFNDFYYNLIFFFETPEFEMFLFIIKFFSAVISGLLIYGIIYLMTKTNYLNKKKEKFKEDFMLKRPYELPAGKLNKKWQLIKKRLDSHYEADYKLAVIEADKLFDDLLKQAGFKGETAADRLKQVDSYEISNIEDLWKAHKMRNDIVHTPDYKINHNEARWAIEIFEKSFTELGALG